MCQPWVLLCGCSGVGLNRARVGRRALPDCIPVIIQGCTNPAEQEGPGGDFSAQKNNWKLPELLLQVETSKENAHFQWDIETGV